MENTPTHFTVDEFDHGTRLDHFLNRQLDESRTQIQKRIKAGGIQINGVTVKKPHRFLDARDEIELVTAEEESVQTTKSGQEYEPIAFDLKDLILFEDDDIIVVNKPAGVLVHPNDVSNERTLMHALIAHDQRIATVGDKPEERAGIVHRLDRLVSGVMVAAKTQEAFNSLKKQFQNRTTEKRYHAMVDGALSKDYDSITLKITRSKTKGRMIARPESQEGRPSQTDYEVVARYANATEVDVDLKTGRTHQIRVHFHALGNPVVGDPLYKIKNQHTINFNRLWLHAYKLSFDHPVTGERVTFESDLPEKLTNLRMSLHKVSL